MKNGSLIRGIIVIITGVLIGCQQTADVAGVSDSRTPAGEIVIDTFEAWMSPDSARLSFVFRFRNRPGNMTDYMMSVNDCLIDARFVTISPTPTPQDRVFSQFGQDTLSLGQAVGDTVLARMFSGMVHLRS